MGLGEIGAGLSADSHGIWTSSHTQKLSYPEAGNERCFELEDASYWFAHRNSCIAALVGRFPPSGCILDVGGGNGYVAKRLIEDGYETTLMEPGRAGAWNGKMLRQIPEVICSTLEDAAFPNESLHAVGCFDVIEHIPDDRGFLDQLHAALKPSGMLYATVPAHQWLWSQNDVAAEHQRRYHRAALQVLLRDSGFDLIFFSYFFAPLIIPVLLLRALPFRLGLSKDRNVLSDEAEHGTEGGAAVAAIKRLLRGEVDRIRRGSAISVGASAIFAAQRRNRAA